MDKTIGFYDKIKVLETLQKVDNISPEVAMAVLKGLKKNTSLLNYFVQKFNNPILVRELYKIGFFDDLPSSVGGRGWVEGTILLRLADKIPDIVSNIVRKTKTDNCGVYDILLNVVEKLDVDLIKELWPDILKWADACQWYYYPDTYTKICQTFLKQKYYNEVLQYFEVILLPQNPKTQEVETRILKHEEAISKFEHFDLEGMKPILNSLEDVPFLLRLVELLEKYLIQAIDIECIASKSDFCKTSYWHSAIEDHEQNQHNHHKDFLLEILRDIIQKLLQKEPKRIKDIICKYLNHEYIIFRRLALHLIRLGKDNFLDIAFEQLANFETLDELYTHHEAFLLLRDIYPLLESKQQVEILSIIRKGPGDEKINEIIEWQQKNYPNKVNVEEYRDAYKNSWIRDRLQMIEGSLTGAGLDYYKTLINKYKKNDHPDFTHYIGECGSVSQKAPLSKDDWDKHSIKECVELMKTWQPENKIDNYLERTSPKGLAEIFKQSLKKRWKEFVPEYENLVKTTIYPTYTYVILEYISEILRECRNKNETLSDAYSVELLVNIIMWSCDKWASATPIEEEAFECGYSQSVCTRSLDLLGSLLIYLEKNETSINQEIFSKIKNTIKQLCMHPDPEDKIDNPQDERYAGHKDPMTVSINHIRPIALRELLRYAVCRSNILNLKDFEIRWEEDVKEEVTKMLISDKAFSVRSVFGECWHWLFYLDKDWAAKYHKSIFPENYSDEYFITAWDSYIVHKPYVYDAGYELMHPLYIHAIDNAINKNVTETHLAPIDRLSEHLAGFYRFGIKQLRMDGNVDKTNPLEYIYSLPPNRLHSHFVWSLWRVCQDEKKIEESKKIWDKSKALWDFRLKTIKLDNKSNLFSEELAWFVHFLNIEKLNIAPSEVIENLLSITIPLLGNTRNDNGLNELTKYLVRVSDKNIKFSTDLLLKTLETHGAGIYSGWYLRRNDIEKILNNAIAADYSVRKKTVQIVHKLGEYGEHWAREYLGKLRM